MHFSAWRCACTVGLWARITTGEDRKQPYYWIQFSEITPDYNQREQRMNCLCVNAFQQKPMVTCKLIWNKKHNNKHGSLITSRIRKGVPAFPAGGSEARQPFTPRVSRVPYSSAVIRAPQTTSLGRPIPLSDSLKVYWNLAKDSSVRPPFGDTFCLQ